jgi:putative MATE family efflux protein
MNEDASLGNVKGTGNILRFALPTILMMVSTSTYVMVDGLIISNMISTDALAAANIIMPLFSVFTAFGFMFATGGSALVSRKLGQGRDEEASRDFTLIMASSLIVAVAISVIGLAFNDTLVRLMGADDTLAGMSADYLSWYLPLAPFLVGQFLVMQFMVVAGKPGISLALSVAGGVANIALDILFIGPFGMGISGAAFASGLSSFVIFVIAVAFFASKRRNVHFSSPSRDMRILGSACYNGMSEMVSEISGSISVLAFNLVMMSLIGPDGVAAITVIMYIQFLAIAVILGYSLGVAPVMGYDYGSEDRAAMRDLYRTSAKFVLGFSLAVFVFMELFGGGVVSLFDAGNQDLHGIAMEGVRIHSFAYLFMGLNLYASSLFTSLSNGKLSAIISSLRALVILIPMIALLSYLIGVDGVWMAIPVTEIATFMVTAYLLRKNSDRYGYGRLIDRSGTSF